MNALLNTTTKWSSPAGGCKLYEADDLTVRWYSTNFSLCAKGTNGDARKGKLLQLKGAASPLEHSANSTGVTAEVEHDKDSDIIDIAKLQRRVDDIEDYLKHEISRIVLKLDAIYQPKIKIGQITRGITTH